MSDPRYRDLTWEEVDSRIKGTIALLAVVSILWAIYIASLLVRFTAIRHLPEVAMLVVLVSLTATMEALRRWDKRRRKRRGDKP